MLKAHTIMEFANKNSEYNFRLKGVSVNASSVKILRNINLEIKQGEFVAIIGKNGAGKTSLLRTFAGLLKPAKNRVLFNNHDFFSLNQKDRLLLRRKIGYIPQQFKLIKETSVFENVMVGRLSYLSTLKSILHMYPSEDIEIVLSCINKIGLNGKEFTPVKKLSGGEQQRVAIARCFAQQPEIILADEPVASLDVAVNENILKILDSVNKRGVTVICVLHNIEMALKYAKRIVLMDKGGIISDTPVKDVNKDEIKKLFSN